MNNAARRIGICVASLLLGFVARAAEHHVFFSGAELHRVEVQLDDHAVSQLRSSPRDDVRGIVTDGAGRWTNVSIHLKGATGSFRAINDKPSFTLSFKGAAFHGLAKIHMNNSVEDPTLANELIGSELFRAAGIPAQRVAHAIVALNGKRLGAYVVKEGFTKEFVARNFTNAPGKIHESPAGRTNGALAADQLESPVEIDALSAAIHERDLSRRWTLLEQSLDVERFAKFLALEILLGHRDGYALARNNFRIYQPSEGRTVFLPAGMDQLFGRAPSMIEPRMSGVVARAFVETSQGRAAHRRECAAQFEGAFDLAKLTQRIDAVGVLLKPGLTRTEFAAWEKSAAELKRDISARRGTLAPQLGSR